METPLDIANAPVNTPVTSPSRKLGGLVINSAKKTTTDLTVRFADMIVAAAGIVAALSWNDAFKSLFIKGGIFYDFANGGPWIAAIVITLFAISLGYWRAKLLPPTKATAATPPKK